MKKIISVCLCICLMSGCDKLLRHGRPVNTAVEDIGSEGVPPHSLTSNTSNASASEPSNTPIPTPEPSKSAQSSDSADTGSSVGKYVRCAVAFIFLIVGCYDVFRYFKPEKVVIPAPNSVGGSIAVSFYKENSRFYNLCYLDCVKDISYTWYFAKRKTTRYFWFNWGTWVNGKSEKIDSKISVHELCNGNERYGSYVCKLSPD
ncbi:MAG: hypothetical protein LE169_01675 [Endomicrobium sp.]|nr:hypothetical protein [Endomicrobium sp.]